MEEIENKPENPILEQPIQEEQAPQINVQELLETYEFFGNTVKSNITIYNGIKLILEKINQIEEKLDLLETKLGNNKN